uniref:Uncharacterized protein n=1 Tax=Microcebus murinus TaxID=30608 RepID=A0A8C5Y044_MICMU
MSYQQQQCKQPCQPPPVPAHPTSCVPPQSAEPCPTPKVPEPCPPVLVPAENAPVQPPALASMKCRPRK